MKSKESKVVPFRRRPLSSAEPPEQLARYLDQLADADMAELQRFANYTGPVDPAFSAFMAEQERRFSD